MVFVTFFYNLNFFWKNIENTEFFEKNIKTSRFWFRYIGDIDVDHFWCPRFLNIEVLLSRFHHYFEVPSLPLSSRTGDFLISCLIYSSLRCLRVLFVESCSLVMTCSSLVLRLPLTGLCQLKISKLVKIVRSTKSGVIVIRILDGIYIFP